MEENDCLLKQNLESCEVSSHGVQTVYLITYSQVDLHRFSKRDVFARIVIEAFRGTRSGLAEIVQWVCSHEKHTSGGTHYHMAVKLLHPR